MELDARKQKVLKAIIDDYIESAEPVGSRTLARKHDLGVSPATIRNEMADLEMLGYLEHLHTSSGRIPSSKGYRFYVNGLIPPKPVSDEEKKIINDWYKARVRRLESLGLMKEAGRAVLPDMDISHFEIDEDVLAALKEAGVYETFQSFPPLYRRIRAYNVAFYKGRTDAYEKALSHLIEATRKGETYGEWNDYGRLPED